MTLFSVLALVIQRTRYNLRLLLMSLLGTTIAATVLSGIVLYTGGVSESVLQRELARRFVQGALVASYRHTVTGPASARASEIDRADGYLRHQAQQIVGLPLLNVVAYGQTEPLRLFLRDQDDRSTSLASSPLASIAFRDDLEPRVIVEDGHFPAETLTPDGDVGVLLSEETANTHGLHPGSRFTMTTGVEYTLHPINVVLTGTWRPREPQSDYWYGAPDFHQRDIVFLTTRPLYLQRIQPNTPPPPRASSFSWALSFDIRPLHATNEALIHSGFLSLASGIDQVLPGTHFNATSLLPLEDYEARLPALVVLLLALSVPSVAVVLYFIAVATDMAIARQRTEIAVLRSRGASRWLVIGSYLVQGLLLGFAALLAGPPLGLVMAEVLGSTSGFLSVTPGPLLPVTLSGEAYGYAAVAVVLSIMATMLPAIAAARATIVEQRRDTGRSVRSPFVQRYFLDVLLIPVAAYGYQLLLQRGSIIAYTQTGDLSVDPLLLLVPALLVLTVTLLALRVMPLLMNALALLAEWGTSAVVLLSFRFVARQPGHAARLTFLLAATVALGMYSGSVAHTIDRNQTDRVLYRNGSQIRLSESGYYEARSQQWSFPPFSDHLPLPDVQDATQVARWSGQTSVLSAPMITVLGIDVDTFWGSTFYRPTFAEAPPEQLTAVLKNDAPDTLVSDNFLLRSRLKLGDHYSVTRGNVSVEFIVAGTVRAFPTLFPGDAPFVIANLSYLWAVLGPAPYETWLKTSDTVNVPAITATLTERKFVISETRDSTAELRQLRADPERRGLFGVLSVGFVVGAVLAMLGMVVHAVLSFRERVVQLGVLRASGLSAVQLLTLFCLELLLLVGAGLVVGIAIGAWTSAILTPFLQIVTPADPHASVPPFVVVIAGRDVLLMSAAILAVCAVAIPIAAFAVVRLRLHEVLMLGEDAA